MATTKRKAVQPANEKALADKIEALKKQIGDKTPTAKQKDDLAGLRKELGVLRFVRIANKRIPKTLKAISGIANLAGAGYVKTDVQVKAIVKALRAEVDEVERKLTGKKESVAGFSLPTDEEETK